MARIVQSSLEKLQCRLGRPPTISNACPRDPDTMTAGHELCPDRYGIPVTFAYPGELRDRVDSSHTSNAQTTIELKLCLSASEVLLQQVFQVEYVRIMEEKTSESLSTCCPAQNMV